MSTPQPEPATNCSRCGEQLPDGAAFCPACGLRVGGETALMDEPTHETIAGPVHVTHVGRLPEGFTQAGHAVSRLAANVRDRLRVTAETVTVRIEAQQRIGSLRGETHRLGEERRHRLYELGEAVYNDDEAGTRDAREAIASLDREIAAKAKEMHVVAAEAEEKAALAKLPLQPTSVLPGPEPPSVPTPPDQPGIAE